jgi:hypothetical protein
MITEEPMPGSCRSKCCLLFTIMFFFTGLAFIIPGAIFLNEYVYYSGHDTQGKINTSLYSITAAKIIA